MEKELDRYITDIQQILQQARQQAYASINISMIEAY